MPLLKANFFALLLISASVGFAQDAQLPNFVVIKVVDPDGSVLPDAAVRVVPLAHGEPSVLRTNPKGVAYLDAQPGTYELTVLAPGFFAETRTVSLEDAPYSTTFTLRIATGSLLPEQTISPSRPIPPIAEQVEVLSMIGDIATFNGKPVVHTHVVLGRHDGSTVGGHVWELHVNPTLEVFVTANATPLKKKPDDASGMKLIDPTQ